MTNALLPLPPEDEIRRLRLQESINQDSKPKPPVRRKTHPWEGGDRVTIPRDPWDDFQEALDNHTAIIAMIDKQMGIVMVALYVIGAGVVITLIGIILGMVAK